MRRTTTPSGRSGLNRGAVIGIVAGLTIGGGAALVAGVPTSLGAMGAVGIASQSDSPTTAADNSPANHASDDREDHAAEHEAHLRDALAPLVEDGTLTEAQVDAIVAALADAGPMSGPMDGPMHGPGDGMRPDAALGVVADLLGIDVDEIQSALSNGQTLADIAVENGSSADAVVQVLVADLKAHLDDEVAAGEHTQAEADQRLEDATTHITAMVNGEEPLAGDGHGPMAGPMDGPGRDGFGHVRPGPGMPMPHMDGSTS